MVKAEQAENVEADVPSLDIVLPDSYSHETLTEKAPKLEWEEAKTPCLDLVLHDPSSQHVFTKLTSPLDMVWLQIFSVYMS